jgi:hypothetical protein
MSPGVSGLPRFLTPMGGARTGFATVQKTASALEAEIRHLALPLGAHDRAGADGVEDYAPMTPRVIEKTHDIVRRLTRLAAGRARRCAQPWICAAASRSAPARARPCFVRERVACSDEGRPSGRISRTIAAGDRSGRLRAAAGTCRELGRSRTRPADDRARRAHLAVGIALAISIAIAFPLGIWSARRRASMSFVMGGLRQCLYTVPALAPCSRC